MCNGSPRPACCACSWARNCGCNYARAEPSRRSSSTEKASTSTLPPSWTTSPRCSDLLAVRRHERGERTMEVETLCGGRAELAVAGVAETGNDEGVLVEMFVDRGGVDRQVETGLLQQRDAF